KDLAGGRLLFEPFLRLGEQLHILDRDDGLVRESLQKHHFVVGEAAWLTARDRNRSERLVVTKDRYGPPPSTASRTGASSRACGHFGVGVGVSDIEWGSATNPLAVHALALDWPRERLSQGRVGSGVGAGYRREQELIAFDSGQPTRITMKEADGAGQDRIEHWLDICLRPADDAEDVAGGGLRVQRRGQLAVARLELLEQPHVFDRNHSLIGEGLEQGDLLVREGLDLSAPEVDRPDGRALSEQRNA